MSTHAAVICKEDNGFAGIYCHWDGYPEHVGRLLNTHYTDPNQVKALIALGDICSLGERVAPAGAHSFDQPEPGTTVAYHRDRGEPWEDTSTQRASQLSALIEAYQAIGVQHFYLFADRAWTHFTPV